MIFIQKGLEPLKEGLEKKGHKVSLFQNLSDISEKDAKLILLLGKHGDYPTLTSKIKTIFLVFLSTEEWIEVVDHYIKEEREFETKVSEVQKIFEEKNYILEADFTTHFNDCFWNGGEAGIIVFKDGFALKILAVGDVRVVLQFKNSEEEIVCSIDKNNSGRFKEDMEPYIPFGDIQLYKMICSESSSVELNVINNNWYESILSVDDDSFENEEEFEKALEISSEINAEMDMSSIAESSDLFDVVEESMGFYEESLKEWINEKKEG